MRSHVVWFLAVAALVSVYRCPTAAVAAQAQVPAETLVSTGAGDLAFDDVLWWRNIGPNRGGRSIAVAGSAARPYEYYFGATGGGLWKTTDGGTTWTPVTDGQIGSSSVGAVAVAASNPDIVYLGMGEVQLRGNVMQGDGVYRSTDAGATWRHLGLEGTEAIGRIRIHPSNPDIVYVAALGHPYGPNQERGVFRSQDGGRTWDKILYRNDRTGAVDLILDPNDPNVLYATLWEVYRKPWMLWSGGPGSGLFKSTDGGDSWTELSRNPGLPGGTLGKITVAVSGANSSRVYANIEAEDGGLYRSDDAGETWQKVNGHRDLWQRAFYFLRIVADPSDRETVYVLNFILLKSTDGGASFTEIRGTHSDHHDLWIDPSDPRRIINGNDGGAAVTVNGGETWTDQRYPTAQIYRIETTADFPYHVCGAQQDNTTACVPSDPSYHLRNPRSPRGEWLYAVGGGENASIAASRDGSNIFYAGATNALTRYERNTGLVRDIQPNPFMVMGEPGRDMPERWNWVYPIELSPADANALYVGSQHLWQTVDQGRTWSRISPDLTRADPATMGNSGGPIVFDQDGPEIYATIYAIAPSHHEANTIWVGSDDGLVHVTRDGGAKWTDVTPPDMQPFTKVAKIEASPHDPAAAFVAGNRYQLDDRAPYLWKTSDYGRTWTKIVTGIEGDDLAHVIREDPERSGLLYAGTEHGVYVSFDAGALWRSLSLNLPDVQVIDLAVEERDLVIATHGRSFYVLDDVAPLRQWTEDIERAAVRLLEPADAVRRVYPAEIDYWLREPADDVVLEILDSEGRSVRRLTGVPTSAGLHRVTWNLRYAGATVFDGMVLEGPSPAQGVWAPPGTYRVRLSANGREETRSLTVRMDPRLTGVTAADLKAQFDLGVQVRDATSAANEAVIRIRALNEQITERVERANDTEVSHAAAWLVDSLSAVERELYQVRNQSPKDKIAFPIKLNNRLSGLLAIVERGDAPPTEAHYRVFRELSEALAAQLARLDRVVSEDLERFNELLAERRLDPVR